MTEITDLLKRAVFNDLMFGRGKVPIDAKKWLISQFCGTLTPFVQKHPVIPYPEYPECFVRLLDYRGLMGDPFVLYKTLMELTFDFNSFAILLL